MVRFNQLVRGVKYSLNGNNMGYFHSRDNSNPYGLNFQKTNPNIPGDFWQDQYIANANDNFIEEEPDTDTENDDEDIEEFLGGRKKEDLGELEENLEFLEEELKDIEDLEDIRNL